MINDAFKGQLDISPEICWGTPPRDSKHWELSRLVARKDHPGAARQIFSGVHDFLLSKGAQGCLCLGSKAVQRVARQAGFASKDLESSVADEAGDIVAFYIPISHSRLL